MASRLPLNATKQDKHEAHSLIAHGIDGTDRWSNFGTRSTRRPGTELIPNNSSKNPTVNTSKAEVWRASAS